MKSNSVLRYKIKQLLPLFIAGIILLFFFLLAIFPTAFTKIGQKDMFEPFLSPNKTHIFGTNDMGYDIFAEFVTSSSSTLKIGVISALLATFIGGVIGLIGGYFKGIFQDAIEVVTNTFLLVPMLLLAIVFCAYFGASENSIILSITLLGWAGTSKSVRIKTKTLLAEDFFMYLKSQGYSPTHILFRHVLLNIKEIIFARFSLTFAWAVLTEASLSFMGLSDISKITFGGMMNLAFRRGGFYNQSYLWFIMPGLAIALLAFSFHLIGYYIEKRDLEVRGEGDLK